MTASSIPSSVRSIFSASGAKVTAAIIHHETRWDGKITDEWETDGIYVPVSDIIIYPRDAESMVAVIGSREPNKYQRCATYMEWVPREHVRPCRVDRIAPELEFALDPVPVSGAAARILAEYDPADYPILLSGDCPVEPESDVALAFALAVSRLYHREQMSQDNIWRHALRAGVSLTRVRHALDDAHRMIWPMLAYTFDGEILPGRAFVSGSRKYSDEYLRRLDAAIAESLLATAA